jgi:antitoxin MazE
VWRYNVITVITFPFSNIGETAMYEQIKTRDVKLVPIGNSQGVRIPKSLVEKYALVSTLILEETERGILLRRKEEDKLSWQDTFRAMAAAKEDWTDFDAALIDGLEAGEDES